MDSTTKTDIELVEVIKKCTDDPSDYILELSRRHGALINSVYKTFTPVLKASGIYMGDVYENKINIVYDSVMSFEPQYNIKYTTHLFNYLRYQCLNLSKAAGVENKHYGADFRHVMKEISNKDSTDEIISQIKEEVNNLSDEIAKEILLLRFFSYNKEESKWKNIAKKVGSTPQNCIAKKKKAVKQIKEIIYNKYGIKSRVRD